MVRRRQRVDEQRWSWVSMLVLVVALQPPPTMATFELGALKDVWDALGHCVDAIESLTELLETVNITITPVATAPTKFIPAATTPTPILNTFIPAATNHPPSTSGSSTSHSSIAESTDPLRSKFDHEEQTYWFRHKASAQGKIDSFPTRTLVHPSLLLKLIASSVFGQPHRRDEQRHQNLRSEGREALTTDYSESTTTTEATTENPMAEEWWDRVDATLVDMRNLTQEVQGGAVDADHADRMDHAATTLNDLVEEAYQNQSLVTPPSYETLALIEETLGILESTITFSIDVAETLAAVVGTVILVLACLWCIYVWWLAGTAVVVPGIVLGLWFWGAIVAAAMVVVVLVVVLVAIPWVRRCRKLSTQKKLRPSEDVALHQTSKVSTGSDIEIKVPII